MTYRIEEEIRRLKEYMEKLKDILSLRSDLHSRAKTKLIEALKNVKEVCLFG